MVEKMRIGLALQPIATALFSNSPFRGGQDTGKQSPKEILGKKNCTAEAVIHFIGYRKNLLMLSFPGYTGTGSAFHLNF